MQQNILINTFNEIYINRINFPLDAPLSFEREQRQSYMAIAQTFYGFYF